MKHIISSQLLAIFLAALVCAAPAPQNAPSAGSAPVESPPQGQPLNNTYPPFLVESMDTRPVEKDLSPDARETYLYLLFIQALLDEDEAALLDVAPELARGNAPLNIWIDGSVWLLNRKSPNSIVFLEQALKQHPDDLSLNLLYSEVLADHGMTSKGVEAMRSYLKTHPDEIEAMLQLALLLVKDRQFNDAQKILDEISPKKRTWLMNYCQGKALVGMGKPAQAIPYLRKAVKAMPELPDPLLELAMAYESDGDLKDARTIYEKLLALNYAPADTALKLVDLSLRMKQPEKAIQYVRRGPDKLAFQLKAVDRFLEGRYYLQAESLLKKMAENEVVPDEIFLMLADLVYEQRRNLNLAFSWLDKIPEHSSEYGKAQVLRIQLLAEDKKIEKALAQTDAALARFPDMQELWDMKIRLLARGKKTDSALETAREAARKWPDSTGFSFLLGSILDEKGQKSEALSIMEDIIKKQPDHFQALNYIGFTLAEENRDLERALELLKKADELSPNQAYIVDSLAWALFRAGQGEEALRQIRRAINLGDTADPSIWEHYGDIARKQGQKNEARKAYRKAIELKPANGDDLRKRLSTL